MKDDAANAKITRINADNPFKRVVRKVKKTGIAESLFEVLKFFMIVVLPSAWIPFEVFLEEVVVR